MGFTNFRTSNHPYGTVSHHIHEASVSAVKLDLPKKLPSNKLKQTNVVKLYRRAACLFREMSGFRGMDKFLPCQPIHVAIIALQFYCHMFSTPSCLESKLLQGAGSREGISGLSFRHRGYVRQGWVCGSGGCKRDTLASRGLGAKLKHDCGEGELDWAADKVEV